MWCIPNLLGVVLPLLVVGVLLWLFDTYVPCAPPIRTLIRVVVAVIVVLWLLNQFCLLGNLGAIGSSAPVRVR